MQGDKPKLSVIIPVYNSEDCLAELQRRLYTSLESICSNWELLYVEDCGGDNSMKVLQRWPNKSSKIVP